MTKQMFYVFEGETAQKLRWMLTIILRALKEIDDFKFFNVITAANERPWQLNWNTVKYVCERDNRSDVGEEKNELRISALEVSNNIS